MTFAAGVVVAWLLVSMLTQNALMGDNIEQSNWAHSFEWGYYKHPPLPTWLLIAASYVLGPNWWLTNVLAALCLLATALATYALALRLTTRRNAQLAILLWGLHLTLTWRVSLYNHNTVLMLMCALMAWAVVSATQQHSMRHWLIAGACAGLALLAKYQAAILIFVLLAALAQGRYLANPFHRKGVLRAALMAALIFAPHAIWLVANDFLPMHYASNQLPKTWSLDGQIATISFALQQMRFFWPSIAAVLVCIAFIPASAKSTRMNRHARNGGRGPNMVWIRFLAFGPLAAVLIIGLAGTRLQNHWGMQTLQFACLGFAVWLGRGSSARPRQLLVVAIVLHFLLMATVVRNSLYVHEFGWQGQADKNYPARELTQKALADWNSASTCRLQYVVGPSFEAGTISVFSGQSPKVLEGASYVASPWIDKSDLQRQGALYVTYAPDELPATALKQGSMVVTISEDAKRPQTIYWGVVRPAGPC
jgi:4-amino-4-deoxy-L-arabinose transferase-like glycosyltransferase